jgi:hypothetical protein
MLVSSERVQNLTFSISQTAMYEKPRTAKKHLTDAHLLKPNNEVKEFT